MNPVGLLLVGVGAYCVCAAAKDWDFFMNNRKAWLFVKLFGRNGARILYIVIGLAVSIVGILMTLGIVRAGQ